MMRVTLTEIIICEVADAQQALVNGDCFYLRKCIFRWSEAFLQLTH